ncbi:hypothetical protein KUTeg_012459 [Tegillarca granosa]|uniref:Uncharacterized protein n=1 Tax=Tegillarca granosa TaxID=220873 RepID=A0ABQ9EZK1_TEGGR|nr:hypothetical protein KUTeg_012459 [Tegillarca granosa]
MQRGQYSGFLILVFVIELSAGIAGFAYKEKLNSGFSEGLKIAIKQYGKDEVKTTTFDDLQTQGCYTLVVSFMEGNMGLIGGVALGATKEIQI